MTAAELLKKLQDLGHTEDLSKLRISSSSTNAWLDLQHEPKENCGFGCSLTEENKYRPIQIIINPEIL